MERLQSINVIVVMTVDPVIGARPQEHRLFWSEFLEFAVYFLLIGLVALTLKYLEIAPAADWSWWVVLLPFALAAAWWAWADASGYTKQKEVDKMDKRKQDRIDRQRDAMGLQPKKRK
jgi:small Trp-rich protein